MDKYNKNYLPVIVETKYKKEIWRIDISTLSMSELIKLKQELTGKSDISIPVLDALIYDEVAQDVGNKSVYYKEQKKESNKRKDV